MKRILPPLSDRLLIVAGALLCALIALAGSAVTGPTLTARLQAQAAAAIADKGGGPVRAHFEGPLGGPTRHAILSGGERLPDDKRAAIARAVASVPGVGGVHWADGTALAEAAVSPDATVRCQDQVVALLRTRSLRFEEASAALAPGSGLLLDEVAAALRPCRGSIIAVTGHTDASGPEEANRALSRNRALAVRSALIARGLPAYGVRAQGAGSSAPISGLDPADPANRRIEFSVLTKQQLTPTPIDTPGAR